MKRRSFLALTTLATAFASMELMTVNRKYGLVERVMKLVCGHPDDIYGPVDQTSKEFVFENGDIILTRQHLLTDSVGDAVKWKYIHASIVIGEKNNLLLTEYSGTEVKRTETESLKYIIENPTEYRVVRTRALKPNPKSSLEYVLETEHTAPIFDFMSFLGIGPESFKYFTRGTQSPLITCVGFVQNVLFAGGLDITKTIPIGLTSPDNFIGCYVYKRT